MSDRERAAGRTEPAADGGGTRTLRIEISSTTIWQVIGAVAVTLLAVRMASAARGLLTLVALAFFFSLALEPAVRRLTTRFGWRRGAAVGAIYGIGIALLVFLVFILVPSIAQLADRIAEDGAEWIANLNAWSSDTLGLPLELPASDDAAVTAGDRVDQFGGQAFGALVGIASAGLGLVFSVATLAMFTFYFSADAPKVQQAVLRLFSPAAQERIGWTWDQAIVQTGGYFYSRLLLMGVNGVGFFITMALVGVPIGLAVSLAVVAAFVSVFIPAVGTYIGVALPALLTLALVGFGGALVVIGYAVVYQQLENYWLSPRISADTMALNGGVAFGAALAGGAIAGPIGAFVALPVAALCSALLSNYARSYDVVYRSSLAGPDDDPDAAPAAGT